MPGPLYSASLGGGSIWPCYPCLQDLLPESRLCSLRIADKRTCTQLFGIVLEMRSLGFRVGRRGGGREVHAAEAEEQQHSPCSGGDVGACSVA